MKKLIVSLFATVALTAGLVSVSGSPVHAATAKKNPYVGVVGTSPTYPTPVSRTYKKGTKPKLTLGVKVRSGSVKLAPQGTISIKIWGPNVTWKKTVRLTSRGLYTVTLPKVTKKGKYHILITYTPNAGQIYKGFKNLSDGIFYVK